MKPSFLPAVVAAVLVALGGCASNNGADGVASKEDAASSASALRSPARRADSTWCWWDCAVWPPRPSIPIDAKHDQVCSIDDGDTKAQFRKYIEQRGDPTPGSMTPDVSKWKLNNWGQYECDECDLDGLVLKLPADAQKVTISLSSARGTTFPGGVRYEFFDSYARDAKFVGGDIRLLAARSDLQCATYAGKVSLENYTTDSNFSGASNLNLVASGIIGDIVVTGARDATIQAGPIGHDAGNGQGVSILAGGLSKSSTVSLVGDFYGDLHLEDSEGTLTFDGGVFHDGHLYAAGATGRMDAKNGGRFDAFDLGGLLGSKLAVVSSVDDPKKRIAMGNGSRVPVGSDSALTPAVLRTLDLEGAQLVSKASAPWPTEPTDLTGLHLKHGAFPANADLSKVILDKASLERVSFGGMTLTKDGKGASFRGAGLSRADFAHATIDGLDFTNADLRGANLYGVTGRATFDQVKGNLLAPHVDDNDTDKAIATTFGKAQLSTSSFVDATLQYADFGDANVAQATLTHAHFEWASFVGAHLQENGVANTTLKDATLLATKWDNADMRGIDLTRADFGPARSVRSSFEGTLLCNAKLTSTVLHDADLRGVFFDVDGEVRLPDGSWITCTPGDRRGVDTKSTDATLGTMCPNSGRAPMGNDLQCTPAQWKVAGGTPDQCTKGEESQTTDGGACTKACQCQSAYCSPAKVCAEPPPST